MDKATLLVNSFIVTAISGLENSIKQEAKAEKYPKDF
jgi:hypothetical protein